MNSVGITNDWGKLSFVSGMEIAGQICALINTYNNLKTLYRPENILCRSHEYLALIAKGTVIGCVRVEKQSYTFTEFRHLSVLKPYRGTGLGNFIIKAAISKVVTPMTYVTVNSNNIPSLSLFSGLGFTFIRDTYLNEDNELVCIGTSPIKNLTGNINGTSPVEVKQKEV